MRGVSGLRAVFVCVGWVLGLAACSPFGGAPERGRIVAVGGSSSLVPLAEAIADAFVRERAGRRVVVSASGTVVGFRRFCDGRLDIAGASRLILPDEEARCRASGLRYLALPVARDGVAVVANPANQSAKCLTLAELERLWAPSSPVDRWQDLRPELPAEKIRLYGPDPGSGTFAFFTTVVTGRTGASRSGYYQTDNERLIARGVAGHRWALGYFGHAYFASHQAELRAVAVDNGFGCVSPSPDAFRDGEYSPLTRDLFIYVSERALARPVVQEFAEFFVAASQGMAVPEGYAPMPAAEHARSAELLARAVQTAKRADP